MDETIEINLVNGGYVVDCYDRDPIIIKDLPAVLGYTERYLREKERENNEDEKAKTDDDPQK